MKKTLVATIMVLAMLCMFDCMALAEGTEPVNVYVTISDSYGEPVLVQKQVTVTDIDNDSALTINDALFCAHEAGYEGGAEAGYSAVDSAWGVSLVKLWGIENGGSYGYYVNNTSARSLVDPVADGDYINAYAYTDLTSWSDTYSFFDRNKVNAKAGEEISLKLSMAGYDADFNPITLPASGALVTIDGKKTEFVTNENGEATVVISEAGTYVISAYSDTCTLVPPVCMLTVTADEDEITDTGSGTEVEDSVPQTGDNTNIAVMTGLLIMCGVVVITVKKNYEK